MATVPFVDPNRTTIVCKPKPSFLFHEWDDQARKNFEYFIRHIAVRLELLELAQETTCATKRTYKGNEVILNNTTPILFLGPFFANNISFKKTTLINFKGCSLTGQILSLLSKDH